MARSKVSAIRKIVNTVNEESRRRKMYVNAQGYLTGAEARALKRAGTRSSPNNDSGSSKGTKNTTTDRVTKPPTQKKKPDVSTTAKSNCVSKTAKTGSIGAGIVKRVEQFETKAAKQAERLGTVDSDEDVVQSIEQQNYEVHYTHATSYPSGTPSTSTFSSAPADSPSALYPHSSRSHGSPVPACAATPTLGPSIISVSVSPFPPPKITAVKVAKNSGTRTTTMTTMRGKDSARGKCARATTQKAGRIRSTTPDWLTTAAEDPFGLFDDDDESDDDEWSKGVHHA